MITCYFLTIFFLLPILIDNEVPQSFNHVGVIRQPPDWFWSLKGLYVTQFCAPAVLKKACEYVEPTEIPYITSILLPFLRSRLPMASHIYIIAIQEKKEFCGQFFVMEKKPLAMRVPLY